MAPAAQGPISIISRYSRQSQSSFWRIL